MNIIFGNYGDNTIALLQWVYEKKLPDVFAVHVDTGWAACYWRAQVEKAQQLATDFHFQVITLTPKANFSELVLDRGRFPSRKFQWCAGFLKGLPLLEWLEQQDSQRGATILLGSRRADSRARALLPEFIEDSEHFGERKVWYPLVNYSNEQRDALIAKTGFIPLHKRSRECEPCIHAPVPELRSMDAESKARLAALEVRVGQPMFAEQGAFLQKEASPSGLEALDMGCGAPYACGE